LGPRHAMQPATRGTPKPQSVALWLAPDGQSLKHTGCWCESPQCSVTFTALSPGLFKQLHNGTSSGMHASASSVTLRCPDPGRACDSLCFAAHDDQTTHARRDMHSRFVSRRATWHARQTAHVRQPQALFRSLKNVSSVGVARFRQFTPPGHLRDGTSLQKQVVYNRLSRVGKLLMTLSVASELRRVCSTYTSAPHYETVSPVTSIQIPFRIFCSHRRSNRMRASARQT
jgi:hypothetical protein